MPAEALAKAGGVSGVSGRGLWLWVVAAGVALGFAYTLSPLTVLVALTMVPLWRWASAGLTAQERRWMLTLFGVAVALRVVSIGGLFLTADPAIPYANFFGDEEFFKRKTTWLRNVSMGIPISKADFIYAFDRTGDSSYLHVLSYLQALVGLAPYGIHVLNAAAYLAAVVVLYKLVRPAFGGIAALMGSTLLLFVPSLFIWSISALKEPLYFLVAATTVASAMAMARAPGWGRRIAAVFVVIAGGVALQGLREGGLALTVMGVVGGYTLWFVLTRPRVLMVACLVLPLLVPVALSRPAVQDRAWAAVHQVALKHWGYINTPGQTYRLMEPQFYLDRQEIQAMTPRQVGQYGMRAAWSYITVPLPWEIESRSALAFLPEQMVWYSLLLLLPFGIVAGLRRDPLLTCVLLAHGCASALVVAVSGGNVGTLVRHRGLALPYLVWLSGLGAVQLALYLLSRAPSRRTAALVSIPDPDGGLPCP